MNLGEPEQVVAFFSFTSEPGRPRTCRRHRSDDWLYDRCVAEQADAPGHTGARQSRARAHSRFHPGILRDALLTIAVMAPQHRLLHVHVAGRGSTIRKIILVHFARLLRIAGRIASA